MSAEHRYDISNEMVRHRVIGLLKRDWPAFMAAHPDRRLELVCRLHEEARTVDQNARMWLMLSLLEQHGVVCEPLGRRMSAVAWHDYLRVKHGFVYGTRAVPMSNGADGWQMIECPNPQPTRKGAKGQMTKAQHGEYMERIHDELHDAGISFDEPEQARANQ